MAQTTYVCDGCGTELAFRDELEKEPGTVQNSWNCGYCHTNVPGLIAEKIKHQTRH